MRMITSNVVSSLLFTRISGVLLSSSFKREQLLNAMSKHWHRLSPSQLLPSCSSLTAPSVAGIFRDGMVERWQAYCSPELRSMGYRSRRRSRRLNNPLSNVAPDERDFGKVYLFTAVGSRKGMLRSLPGVADKDLQFSEGRVLILFENADLRGTSSGEL